MLCLSRKKDQRIFIDAPNGTRITITYLGGIDKARIGIDAPKDYHIVREELDGKLAKEVA